MFKGFLLIIRLSTFCIDRVFAPYLGNATVVYFKKRVN